MSEHTKRVNYRRSICRCLLGLLALSAAGCSTAKSETAQTATWGLEQVLYGGDERAEKVREAKRLTADCMHERGWVKFVGNVSIVDEKMDAAELAKADAEVAYGFGYPYEAPPDPNDAWILELSQPQREQMMNDLWSESADSLGCAMKSHLTAFGDLAVTSPAISTIFDEVSARYLADADVIEISARWSTCMKSRGYSFRNPDSILDELGCRLAEIESGLGGREATGTDNGITELRALEHTYYDADMSCRADTNFTELSGARRQIIETEVIEQHPELLTYLGDES